MLVEGLMLLAIAVLLGIFPHTSPINPYLAMGSASFLGGLFLGWLVFKD